MSEYFSSRLSEAIRRSPHNQAKIASLVGIAPPYLSDLKTGKRTNPSNDVVARLATVLEVTRAWLMGGDDPPRELASESMKLMEDAGEYLVDRGPALDPKAAFEQLARTGDLLWLVNRLTELNAEADAGDRAAREIVALVTPIVWERLEALKKSNTSI